MADKATDAANTTEADKAKASVADEAEARVADEAEIDEADKANEADLTDDADVMISTYWNVTFRP